ncbi:PP2C family protein-serine/threonine phosphatase [Streptomyces sp. NBC_01304]|uniref:PP2C family protein-serine/threonine phosphatase n=1 Tax=Streptomyces sp. NBC_01304 TaxID=2903818 RepID=UPI002E141891|nr:serine/threonine-protein phosphatase [Streptomyces sp. NBC_01304]
MSGRSARRVFPSPTRPTGRAPWLRPLGSGDVGRLAVALLAAGLLPNLLSGEATSAGPLVAMACVTAGVTLSFRSASLLLTLAFVADVLLAARHGSFDEFRGFDIEAAVPLGGAVGLYLNRLLGRYGRRMRAVSAVAEEAQRAILPTPPKRLGPLSVAVRYRPAQREARIGGDIYAVQQTRFGTRLLIGDVRGKGMDAVGAAAVALGAFREAAEQAASLPRLADRLEHALLREAAHDPGEGRVEGFTTALLGEVTPDGATLRLLNRGHPAPYLLHGDEVRALHPAEPDLPLGMGRLSDRRAVPDAYPLPYGAVLLLVTDGVTEARDGAGAFYDPAERLAGHGPWDDPATAVDVLMDDVRRWSTGSTRDDMAVLAVRRVDPGPVVECPLRRLELRRDRASRLVRVRRGKVA